MPKPKKPTGKNGKNNTMNISANLVKFVESGIFNVYSK